MKLLFCIKALNNPGGGAERVMVEIANGLHRRGHHVSVMTFEPPGGSSFYKLDSGIERLDLGIGSTTHRATPITSMVRMAKMRSVIKDAEPEIVVGFMHSMFVLLAFALLGRRIPLIASEHIVPKHYASRPIEGLLVTLSSFMVDAITCVSTQVKGQYPANMQRKLVAIPNPTIAPSVLRADVVGKGGGRRVLLSVGRLTAQKDHDTLIRAFAAVAEQHQDWVLRIVGDGELRSDLEQLAIALGVGSRVEISGSVADISREYLAAQVFVMPSRYESFGLAAAEALAHGLPTIGFADCAGINVLIQTGKNGMLVNPEPDRVGALAAAMHVLMSDARRRMQLAANTATPPFFELDTVLDAWTLLFKKHRSKYTEKATRTELEHK